MATQPQVLQPGTAGQSQHAATEQAEAQREQAGCGDAGRHVHVDAGTGVGIEHNGVVVQRMVNSERSGVMFTADPSTGDTSRIVIEAAHGLGEVVVSGTVEPDTQIMSKKDLAVVSTRVGTQTHKIVRGPDGNDQHIVLTGPESTGRVLSDDDANGPHPHGSGAGQGFGSVPRCGHRPCPGALLSH